MNRSEAFEEAERLTKIAGKWIVPKYIDCAFCDYDQNCGRCFGDGSYFILIFEQCSHEVTDTLECEHSDCVPDPSAGKPFLSITESGITASVEAEDQLVEVVR